jgi:hypothetical protein
MHKLSQHEGYMDTVFILLRDAYASSGRALPSEWRTPCSPSIGCCDAPI